MALKKSSNKSLKLKLVFSLENAEGETVTVLGTRNLFARTYSHQLVSIMVQLLLELAQRAMPIYIRYLNTGEFPNEIFQHDHDALRSAARTHNAKNAHLSNQE